MRNKFLVLLLIIYIDFSVLGCVSSLISPGSGVGKYHLGAPEHDIFTNREEREKLAKDGLLFTFNQGEISSITVANKKYSTKEGVRVGDSIKKIENMRMNLATTKLQLEKGDEIIPTNVNIVSLDGIRFLINEDKISGIIVVKE